MNAAAKDRKPQRSQPRVTTARSSPPWGTIAATLVIVLFAGVVLGYVWLQNRDRDQRQDALAPFVPSSANQDPSTQIPGVVVTRFAGGIHVEPTERVAYTSSPPLGGAHDSFWAACGGVVYDRPVRSENLVHSLEHGAAWIAYNPDKLNGDAVNRLASRVQGKPYTVMSPYPGLDQPISLQTWGHQLKLAEANDPRIDQFITALRRNPYTHPEVGASCSALGPGAFDQDRPPPFEPAPPVTAAGQAGVRTEGPPDAARDAAEPTPGAGS